MTELTWEYIEREMSKDVVIITHCISIWMLPPYGTLEVKQLIIGLKQYKKELVQRRDFEEATRVEAVINEMKCIR